MNPCDPSNHSNRIIVMKKIIYICLLLFSIPLFLNAYESMHEKTPVNKIQILELPARLALEAKTDDSYFIKDNGLFRSLFRYITKNDISMTTPVEADINPGKMRFFVGDKDKTKNLESNDLIKVYKVPTKMVVSVGIRGSYSEKNFSKNKIKLDTWLKKNKDYSQAGAAYAVYWNGPFIPGFLKRSEIHIPIRKQTTTSKNIK